MGERRVSRDVPGLDHSSCGSERRSRGAGVTPTSGSGPPSGVQETKRLGAPLAPPSALHLSLGLLLDRSEWPSARHLADTVSLYNGSCPSPRLSGSVSGPDARGICVV